jgi:hypothetical protein
MQSRVGLKSIPVDFIVFDELDEAPQNAVDMALERMAHSEFRNVLQLSNPTLPSKRYATTIPSRFFRAACVLAVFASPRPRKDHSDE